MNPQFQGLIAEHATASIAVCYLSSLLLVSRKRQCFGRLWELIVIEMQRREPIVRLYPAQTSPPPQYEHRHYDTHYQLLEPDISRVCATRIALTEAG
jgi:hypothetical protein